MQKIYQKSWHAIDFSELESIISIKNLPGENFYIEFYEKFNKKYGNLNQLDKNWLLLKKKAAEEIAQNLNNSKICSILSLGAGLGIIEKKLFDLGYKNLYIQEVSKSATIYSRKFLEEKNIFIGNFPDCINTNNKFDYIILGGIEYLFNDVELENLLYNVKRFMHEKSKLIILSWSIEEESAVYQIKSIIKRVLIKIRLFNPGQFWGYSRKLKELNSICEKTGFKIKIAKLDRTINPWTTGFLFLDN